MKLELIVATMNRNIETAIQEITEGNKINSNCLIINQIDDEIKKKYIKRDKSTVITYREKGLSKSRNRGLENTNAEIGLISDDDVKYLKGYEQVIEKAFDENPDADIITFKIETPQGDEFKKYGLTQFKHTKKSILKVSSIEIAFRTKSIKENNIEFDERFGLGAKYNSGEENIFLMDSINKGLNIKYIPEIIGIHPKESSGKVLDLKGIYSKGALFYRLFGYKAIILNTAFVLKKYKQLDSGIIKSLIEIYKGTFEFIKNERR